MYLRILFVFILIPKFYFGLSQRAEDYLTVAEDGAWCWFSDPRAIHMDGNSSNTYFGYVTSRGDVMISMLKPDGSKISDQVIYQSFQSDDHVNPSILALPDKRIMVFFTRHNGKLFYTKSTEPEDITSFTAIDSLDIGSMACYTNPIILSEENNRIYLFFRGGYDWKPSYIFSDNLGESWSKPRSFVSNQRNDPNNRPYTKVISDERSNIHFAFTDGHPREENQNSIYYLRYHHGSFYDAAGVEIGDTTALPIMQESIPKVYNGIEQNARAWIWDIAVTQNGNPVLAYTTLPEETRHIYHYAIWEGEWKNQKICSGGSAFPRFNRPKEKQDPEPHYSGGICIDSQHPSTVYLSRPVHDRFEIQRWQKLDDTFSYTPITGKSLHDNVRPFVVRNDRPDLDSRLLWMHIDKYEHYTNYKTSLKGNLLAPKFSSDIVKEDILQAMTAVADWQIKYFDLVKHHRLDWTNGALYAGMMEWAKVSEHRIYQDWLFDLGRAYGWQPGKKMYHADDIVVAQMYLDMYKLMQDDEASYRILGPTEARLNYVVSHPSSATLELDYSNPTTLERWSWCDALFMAPPVYVKMANITGDNKYLEFMDREFNVTYEYLYDPDEHLFYRDHRYFPDKIREANGAKVFWGRGNGWVMGGLISILKDLPLESSYRSFYEELFLEMAMKVADCQGEDGFWNASLLDPESYPNPETSSSAFFTYALAYGVNSGLLDKARYGPQIEKAWKALVSAVHADGKLGWVQPIGENPKDVTSEMTEVYGVGAFLLAGTEMLKYND